MSSEALTNLNQPLDMRKAVIELTASAVLSALKSKPLLLLLEAHTSIELSASTVLSALKSKPLLLLLEAHTSDLTRQFWVSYGHSDVSTVKETPSEELNDQIEKLFKSTREGFYDDNLVEEFPTKLTYIVRCWGDAAIVALAPFIIGKTANAEVAAETLRGLSHVDDASSYNFRLTLILTALQSPSSWIRDAATLALAAMDDPAAVPHLTKALDQETNQELRLNMQPVLEYLKRRR